MSPNPKSPAVLYIHTSIHPYIFYTIRQYVQ